MKQTLSIIIPCYNEKDTILQILEKINKVHLYGVEKEIIIIEILFTTSLIYTKFIKKYFVSLCIMGINKKSCL